MQLILSNSCTHFAVSKLTTNSGHMRLLKWPLYPFYSKLIKLTLITSINSWKREVYKLYNYKIIIKRYIHESKLWPLKVSWEEDVSLHKNDERLYI